jgi:hypothetical protein
MQLIFPICIRPRTTGARTALDEMGGDEELRDGGLFGSLRWALWNAITFESTGGQSATLREG